jgi:hypothetical protein
MAEAFKQLGEAVAGIFQERYYADQMKQFRENELLSNGRGFQAAR